MARDWDLKKQAEMARQAYDKRESWMKSLSHFAGKERESTPNAAPMSASQADVKEKNDKSR